MCSGRFCGCHRVEAAGRAGAVLAVQVPLGAPQPGGVQADPIRQRLHPPGPASVAAFHSDRDVHWAPDRMTPDRPRPDDAGSDARPHQLHAVGVAPGDHRAHDPGEQHLARRRSTLRSRPARPAAPCRADPTGRARRSGSRTPRPTAARPSRPFASSFRAQCTVAVLWPSECSPRAHRLEPGLTLAPQMPLLDRVERAGTQVLGLLRGQVFAHPRLAQRDANDCAASTVNPCACSTAANAARRALRSLGVRRGIWRAISHAGSDFTARLRARNSPSTALYTLVPVKNRVRISRHCAASGAAATTARGSARLSDAYAPRPLKLPGCSRPAAGDGFRRSRGCTN